MWISATRAGALGMMAAGHDAADVLTNMHMSDDRLHAHMYAGAIAAPGQGLLSRSN